MLSLDQRGPAPGSGQRTRQRTTTLSGADDDRVIVLRMTHAIALLLARGVSDRVWLVEQAIAQRSGHESLVRTPGSEKRRRSGGEPAEKRLGLIRAFGGGEEVNAIGLFYADCADGSDQVVARD
jgi:hypothetical protein